MVRIAMAVGWRCHGGGMANTFTELWLFKLKPNNKNMYKFGRISAIFKAHFSFVMKARSNLQSADHDLLNRRRT